MGYLETPEYKIYSREELKSIKPDMPDENIGKLVKAGWDRIAKPLDSLGRFEDIIARIGAVQKTNSPDISRRAVVMVCADNGIVEEGVSQSGQDVTREVASWMGKGISSVCRMAAVAGVETIPVDMGINMDGSPEGVIDMKVMKGTRSPGRDKVLRLCLAAELTLRETTRALELSGNAVLYPRRRRDIIITVAINQKTGVINANLLLDKYGEEPLS